jgi:predicted RNA-binding protein with RPS1 domain
VLGGLSIAALLAAAIASGQAKKAPASKLDVKEAKASLESSESPRIETALVNIGMSGKDGGGKQVTKDIVARLEQGLPRELLKQALEQAREARLFILDKMLQVLPTSRTEISSFAPRLITMKIPTDKIREVIGPGGKVIRGIIEQTGVKIDVQDDGTVTIASVDEAAAKKAQQIIDNICAVAEKGRTYLGKVQRIAEYGAFVEILPSAVGLLHVSEIDWKRIEKPEDVLKVGELVDVKLLEIDQRSGKLKLSRKVLLPRPPKEESKEPREGHGNKPQEGGERHSHSLRKPNQ